MCDEEKTGDDKGEEDVEVPPNNVDPDTVPPFPMDDGTREVDAQNQESAWISQWLDQVRDIEEIAVCEVIPYDSSRDVLHANADPMTLSRPRVLIDSGASSSVVGRPWVTRWVNLAGISQFPVCTPSNRVFRFGNKMSYGSCGMVLLSGKVSAVKNGRPYSAELTFSMDVIELDVPFLLSRKA